MRLTFSTVLLLWAHILVSQIASFPHTQSFEQVFITGTDVTFIANWQGNEVATTNRIFQGTDPRNGAQSLNIIPTSSFSAEILFTLNMSSLQGGKVKFYAFSKENVAGSTRPAVLYFSTSINGGNSYSDRVQIGDASTFPNNNTTSYSQYEYEMPAEVAGEQEVLIKIEVERGDGSGAAAELVMDDFTIEEALPSLSIANMSYLGDDQIRIQYNQNVTKVSAEEINNYSLNFGFGSPAEAVQDSGDASIVNLTFPKPFVNNTYQLTVNNIENIDASSVASNLTISAKNEKQTPKRQIVINEIFADPTGGSAPAPVVLPAETSSEFIELYNTSSEAIEITDFTLSGGNIDAFTIAANEFVILTANNNVAAYQSFGNTIGVSSWNTLSNAGEQLILRDQLGNLVDSLSYTDNWYEDNEKADGAWTLEQINPNLSCSGRNNWRASNAPQGGTPGAANSIYDISADLVGPSLDTLIINSPTEITLVFSELMDVASLNNGLYTLSNGLTVSSISARPSLLAVDLQLNAAMTSGTNYTLDVTNVTDCAGNANTQTSLSFLFDNEPPSLSRFVFKREDLIDLIFDEPLTKASAETETNFVIDNGIGQAATSTLSETDESRVSITLENPLILGNNYQITLNNIKDSLDNTSNNQNINFNFENKLDTLVVVSSQLLDVYFDEPLNEVSTTLSNYLVEDIGQPVSANIDVLNARLIHLTFDSAFPENRAIEISFEEIQNTAGDYLQALNSTFVYDTDDPDLISVDVVDANNLQLNFDENLDQSTAEIINNYAVNNGLGIPASAALINEGNSILLNFNQAFTQEVENRLTYTGIEDLSGNAISTNRTINFTYDTRPPRFDALIVFSPKELLLSFTEELNEALAEERTNYSVNNAIGNPLEVTRLDSATNKVLLTFESLGNNSSNTLTISNLRDLFSNDLNQDITVDFTSLMPDFGNFQVTSDSSLQIQFTKTLTRASAENVENYGFDGGIGSFEITQDPNDGSIVDIFLTTQLKEGIKYRLVVDSLADVFGNVISATSYDFRFNDGLNTIEILNSSSLRLNFDSELDEILAENTSNYSINEGIGNPLSAVLNPANPNQVTLVLGSNLQESSAYEITLSNLTDSFGGSLPNFTIEFLYDVTPPVITTVNSIYHNEIEVVFNEKLDPATALALNHYSIDNGIGQPVQATFTDSSQKRVTLLFNNDFIDEQSYVLSVDRIEDKQGKALSSTNVNFTFEALAAPSFRQVVINEVYFDVDAGSGLAPHEFVEILNLSPEAYQLRDFKLTDGNDTARFNSHWIRSAEHLVLSKRVGADAFNGLYLVNFPSLANGGETIYLLNRRDEIIDSLAFDKTLYNDENKENGGFSVELINPEKPCFDAANYAASIDVNGGTPGARNSVYDNTIDNDAPVVNVINVLSNTSIHLSFNESMDIASLSNERFSLSSGIGVSSIALEDQFGKNIILTLATPFERGQEQTLDILGVQDCSGNALTTQVNFILGAQPAANELLITEIMATPTPVVGLPALEYIEIYNNTASTLALNDVYLSDNAGRTPVGDISIEPNAYLILTKQSSVAALSAFGTVIGINSFPTFTIQDEARLENEDGTVIFSISYDQSFYQNESKKAGGYSMEMIRLNPACQSPDNWKASDANLGGTPGSQNSVFTANPDSQRPLITAFEVLSDTSFSVSFSEAMNSATLIPENFRFSPLLSVENVTLEDAYGYQLTIEIDGPIIYGLSYEISFSGIADCAGNNLPPTSFEFSRGREAQPYELIVTEIMAQPTPSRGLPESEYIEIYNTSDDILSLKDVVLADAVNSTRLPDTVIHPQSYMLLVPNTKKDTFGENTLGLFNWPNLNRDKETIKLFNAASIELFSLRYTDAWYRSSNRAEGGYSLEMIDLNFPCTEDRNWSASEANQGGTPGQVNSINGNNPDNEGPELLQAIMLNEGSIQLRFSERLDPGRVDLSDFTINNGLTFIAYTLDETEKILSLYTSENLTTNLVYAITAENLTDCTGNLIKPESNSVNLIVPALAAKEDIVVNEVLFNPRTGSSRFVEFYNRSQKFINLKNWRIAGLNNNRLIIEQDYFLAPQSYFAITDDISAIQAQYPATIASVFIEISSMPSMRDDSGAAVLLDPDGSIIDRFDYNEDYHSPLLNNKEGVSLERISFSGNSNDENNWFSASSLNNFASPGFANSQTINNQASNNNISVAPASFSPEISGAADFTTITYNFDNPGNVLNVNIFDARGNLIKRLSENKLVGTTPFFTWDGTKDDGSRARIGYYMILSEIIQADGRVSYLKEKVAIGGRF